MKAVVHITLKPGVFDPQGKTISNTLGSLGFEGVEKVRQGKFLEMELADEDEGTARERIQEMCERLLANTVIEDYRIDIE